MPRAAIYSRVSTDEQARPGSASIPHQIEECRKLADSDGIPVAEEDVFVDDETGQILNRPGLTHLLGRLSSFSHIYIYDATRLARRRRIALTIREELEQNDVQLRLVHGDTSQMDDESRVFLESIQDAASEAEIIRFKRRTRMGRENRALRGLHAGKVPIGWQVMRDSRGKSTGLEHDSMWDGFFRDLEKLFLEGYSYSGLPREMYARGHVSPRSNRRWAVSTLKYTLKNPLNMGHVVFGWTSRPGDHWVVTEDAFPPRWQNPAAVQVELRRRDKLHGGATKRRRRFVGLLRCGHCGWRMTTHPKKRHLKDGTLRVYVRYRCSKHLEFLCGRQDQDCAPNYISETKVIDQISAWLERLTLPEALDKYLAEMSTIDQTAVKEESRRLERRLAEIERILTGLTDRLALVPESGLGAVLGRMEELTQERSDKQRRLEILWMKLQQAPDLSEVRRTLLRLSKNTQTLLREAPPHTVQAELSRLFPDGIYVFERLLVLP